MSISLSTRPVRSRTYLFSSRNLATRPTYVYKIPDVFVTTSHGVRPTDPRIGPVTTYTPKLSAFSAGQFVKAAGATRTRSIDWTFKARETSNFSSIFVETYRPIGPTRILLDRYVDRKRNMCTCARSFVLVTSKGER